MNTTGKTKASKYMYVCESRGLIKARDMVGYIGYTLNAFQHCSMKVMKESCSILGEKSGSQFHVSLIYSSLGTNSSMFTNCLVFCDVRHVRSSVLDQNVMFSCVRNLVLLLCDQTSLGTYSLMFAKCSVFCDV